MAHDKEAATVWRFLYGNRVDPQKCNRRELAKLGPMVPFSDIQMALGCLVEGKSFEEEYVEPLRKEGLSDSEIFREGKNTNPFL